MIYGRIGVTDDLTITPPIDGVSEIAIEIEGHTPCDRGPHFYSAVSHLSRDELERLVGFLQDALA